MSDISEKSLESLIDELRQVATDRKWAFYIREARKQNDVIVCLHPYPTSSMGGSPEYFRLNRNPRNGLYSRSSNEQSSQLSFAVA